MKNSTNTEVNWPVFQATAALLGGYLAAGAKPVSGQALADQVDKSFVNLYRVMNQMAQRIEYENANPGDYGPPQTGTPPPGAFR